MNKNNFLTVTIIIPTYNRADKLEKALLSINEIDYPKKKYEVIVINDGSTDNTEEIVKKMKEKVNYKIRYFFQENKKLSAARNLAIQNSKKEIIVSVDDDMLFPKEWLKELLAPLQNPVVGVVGGPSIAPDSASFFQRCVDYCMTSSFVGTGGMIGTTKKSLFKYWPRGGNMAIRKKALNEVGLFDEKFIPSEEIDLDRRIEKAGYHLCLAKDAKVWHLPRSTLKGFLKQIFSRGFMKIQFLRRYKESFELLYFFPLLFVLWIFFMSIFSFFNKIISFIFVSSLIIYLGILIMDALFAVKKIKKIRAIVLIPVLMFLQHISYGLGTLRGITKKF